MRFRPARTGRALLVGLSAVLATVLPAGVVSAHSSAAVTTAPVCGPAKPGQARCLAEVRTDVNAGIRSAAGLPAGYGPADLHAAYHLPATGGAGQTVAVVDAGNDPNAEADLAVYRSTYGLSPCTVANGCLSILNQNGQTGPLPSDQYWSIEIALDLDTASAACPACRLMLVEGNTAYAADLGAAVNAAAAAGATEISNSYGLTEQNGVLAYAADYAHPGVAVTVSSGDSGYGIPNVPAVYPTVIAVGGTTLTPAPGTARGWTESAWAGAGSGCSAWVNKPAWQHDPNCSGRITADVAADADPATGIATYDTDHSHRGWYVVGGTSAASPFVAGVIALAGNPGRFPNAAPFYTATTGLNDVTTGSNVSFVDCGGDYQCTAGPGYDGPTGNGTPNGLSAF